MANKSKEAEKLYDEFIKKVQDLIVEYRKKIGKFEFKKEEVKFGLFLIMGKVEYKDKSHEIATSLITMWRECITNPIILNLIFDYIKQENQEKKSSTPDSSLKH